MVVTGGMICCVNEIESDVICTGMACGVVSCDCIGDFSCDASICDG